MVAYFGRSLGCDIHWEWSRRCRAWKWDLIDRMRSNMNTFTAILRGCPVGLVNASGTGVIGKESKPRTNNSPKASICHVKVTVVKACMSGVKVVRHGNQPFTRRLW